MKYCMMIVAMMSASVFGQPMPEVDESFDSFKARYIGWYDTIPEKDRAWEEMKAIDAGLRERLDGLRLTAEPSDDDWDASVAFVRGQGELLNRIRGYSSRAFLAMSPDVLFDQEPDIELPKAIGLLIPNLGATMKQSRLLVIDAILAGQAGDHARVLADIRAVRDLQRFVPVSGAMIELLVEIAISSVVAESILSDQIDLADWIDQDLDQLANLFSIPPWQGKMTRAIESEQWMMQDMLGWVYVNAQHGKITFLGAKRFLDMVRQLEFADDIEMSKEEKLSALARARRIRSQLRPFQDQMDLVDDIFRLAIVDMNTPPYELKSFQSAELIEVRITQEADSYEYAPVVITVPDFSRMYGRIAGAQGVEGAVAFVIGLHRHHRKHGLFPVSLAEIETDFLPDLLIDPYSGQSLKYKVVDGQPLIYSLGPDRDDDGGRPVIGEDGNPEAWPEFLTLDELEAINATDPASIDGDWILYPMIP